MCGQQQSDAHSGTGSFTQTQTHTDTHRHTQTHTDTHRHTQTHRHRHTHSLSPSPPKVGIGRVPAMYREVGGAGNGTAFVRGQTSAAVPVALTDTSAVTAAGGFARAFANYTLLSAGAEELVLRTEMTLLEKTATRLPEALFVRFRLPSLCNNKTHTAGTGRWVLDKVGSGRQSETDPLRVVDGGAKHNHVVRSFACQAAQHTVRVTPVTSPLVSVGEPTAFPTPVRGEGATDVDQGISLLVLNNIWNTNYRMWQEGDLRVVFDIAISVTGAGAN